MVDYMPKFGYDNIIVGYILSDSRPNAKWKCYGFYMLYAFPCSHFLPYHIRRHGTKTAT